MATSKTKQKSKLNRSTVNKKRTFDVNKYIQDVKIGDLKLETILQGSSNNMQAIAAANKAIIDGYTDVAKCEYEMLKELLNEIKAIGGRKSDTAKQLKKLVKHTKKDLQDLLKMAKKTNADTQRIITKRSNANSKAWKKVVDDTRKKVSKKKPGTEKKTKAKASAIKKAAAKIPAEKKVTAKKPTNAKTAVKKTPAKEGKTATVTQAAVLAAIRGGHRTPQAIANAMQANPVQVSKALSRYTQQGLIVRTQPGHYALEE